MCFLRLLILLAFISTAGCTAAVVATASAIGAAGSAIDTGASVYSNGKLDSAELANLYQLNTAVRVAADELGMHVEKEWTRGDGKHRIKLVDDKHKVVDVTLEPRTRTMTRMRIDVGWFGSQPTARLISNRIRKRLPNVQNVLVPTEED